MSESGETPGDGSTRPGANDESTTSGRRRYDSAFEGAVRAGFLTPFEAYSRGKRESYAMRLIERFQLTDEQAYAVADNEMTLIAARNARPVRNATAQAQAEAQAEAKAKQTDHGTPSGSARGLICSLLVLVGLIAAGVAWWRLEQPSAERGATTVNLAIGVETDDFGDVIRVKGDSPQQVLVRYCDAHPEFAARGLMESNSAAVPVRIGVLESKTTQGELLAIPIREDRHTGQWFAGDGGRTLVPVTAPPGASRAVWPAAR